MGMYKVEICGVNTAKLPLLSEEEKKELFDKIGKGDRAARETFIKGNLRLVLSIIQRFYNSGENIDDLFQIGCIGLMKAVDHFDVTMNVKFSTYAVPMIIGELRRYLRDNNSIRVSRSIRDTAYKAIYTKEMLRYWKFRQRTLYLRWMRSKVRFHCTSRYMQRAETPYTFWIRSVIKRTKKKNGSRRYL